MKSVDIDPRWAAISWYSDRCLELENAALKMRSEGWQEEWIEVYDAAAIILDRAAEAEDKNPDPAFLP